MEILKEPRFAPFLDPDFDAISFASVSLTDTSVASQIDRLQSGIQALDSQLRSEVLQHQSELSSHTAKILDLETTLQKLSLSVRSLYTTASELRTEIAKPHQRLASEYTQLANLQATVNLLRPLNHRNKLIQRLGSQLSVANVGILDLAKAAKLLVEVSHIDAQTDLRGIHCVDEDSKFLILTTGRIHSQARSALQLGLESMSQADVGSALQVFYNLEVLPEIVSVLVQESASSVEKAFSSVLLNPRISTMGGGGEALWERMREALDVLKRTALQVWHVQRVLAKKRDPLKHELFLNVVCESNIPHNKEKACSGMLPLDRFWMLTLSAVQQSFREAFQKHRNIREAFVGSYPRLFGMIVECATQILKEGKRSRDTRFDALGEEQSETLCHSARDFEEAHFKASAERLREAVNSAFAGGSRAVPTAAELQKIIARIHEEVKACNGLPGIAALTAETIGDGLCLAAERAGTMAVGGPEVRSVRVSVNAAQMRNVHLCNCLQELHRSVFTLLPRFPKPEVALLSKPLQDVEVSAVSCVLPIFKAEAECIENELLGMHRVDWSPEESTDDVIQTSAYMKRVVAAISRCRMELLSSLNVPQTTSYLYGSSSYHSSGSSSSQCNAPLFAKDLTERLAGRTLGFFMRHAALLRPLGQQGKLQLAKDASELEGAVASNFISFEHFPVPFKILRSFRKLLFMDTEALVRHLSRDRADAEEGGLEASPLSGTCGVPATVFLHHLFSRGPPSLVSPHARKSLTAAQYSVWLDQHSDEDALGFIRAAVEAAEQKASGEIDEVLLDILRQTCSGLKSQMN